MESVFFAKPGEKGLNETSATKLCAIASNLKTKDEAALTNLSFLNIKANIVGSSGEKLDTEYGVGIKTVQEIDSVARRIGHLNGFIAWCREAGKALEAHRAEVRRYSLDEYLAQKGIEKPIRPVLNTVCESYSLQDVINMMNIKERAEYLALEAKAAALGTLIHPDGAFDDARNKMHMRIAKPTSVTGSGRDMVVYYYTPSVDPNAVDKAYETLQRQYQNYESSLNHIKSDLRKKQSRLNEEASRKYSVILEKFRADSDAYNQRMMELTLEHNQWLSERIEEAAKLKIAIPECYQDLLKELYEIGK